MSDVGVRRIFVLAVLFIVNAAITMVSFVVVLLVFSLFLQLGSRSSRYHWERIDKLNTNQVVSKCGSHSRPYPPVDQVSQWWAASLV